MTDTAPRLSSEIATIRPEPRVAAKRYQLHEEGRELSVVLPLVNKGPGWAYDLTVQGVAVNETIIVEEDVLSIGDVRAGDFSVVLRVLVAIPCREAIMLLDVSWRMAGSPERQSRTFTVALEAQRSDVDWIVLEEKDPYSITVAEGSRFVGRAARVRSITNRFTRATMESVLLDGQKRVGKSSLALAVRDAVTSQGSGNTRVIYREFGEYGTEDPAETVAALGRTIADEMLIDLPTDASVPQYEFKGTLAPLSQLARLMLARSPEKRFLIMLDEFDEIPPELYQHGRLADVFFQNLRTFSGQKNVGVMLVGGERLRYILSRQGDQLNRFSAEHLSYFHRSTEWEDYGALIQSPSQPDINWDLACITQLYDLTNGHPYFTNLLCREVYSTAISARDTEITPAEVSAAFTSLAGNLELNHFAHFWMDGILAVPNLTQDIELDRRRVLIAAARAVRAGDAINLNNVVQHKDADLDAAKVKAFLGEFAQRNVLRDDKGTFRFVLPLFEAWLVNVGITKLIPEQSAQEQAAQAKRIEDQVFVTASETTNLAASWPSYRGQAIGSERIRDWLNQVSGNQDQRILFKLLQNVRFVSEGEIREKLRLAQEIVRKQTTNRLPASRAERRYDLVFVDDVVATGRSLRTNLTTFFAANSSIAERSIPVVVVVLLATMEGEQHLRDAMVSEMSPNIDLRVCEHIDQRMLPFGAGSTLWASEAEADRARSLVHKLGSLVYKTRPFGYGDTGLLLVFPQSVPNNSLPILHSSGKASQTWNPLFPRPVN